MRAMRATASVRRLIPGQSAGWWLVVGLLVTGCEVRDEQVRTAGATGMWSIARPTSGPGPRPALAATGPDYVEGYDSAARQAAATGRPLLVVFGASWCRWTGELARGPLADPAVVARTRRCVCTFVDADRDPTTCRAFGVTVFPTLIVADAAGRECFRATGAAGAGDLSAAIDAVPFPGDRRRLADEGPRSDAATDVTR